MNASRTKFPKFTPGVQLALVDTSYNGKGVRGTIASSPKLMEMINSGITDPKQLVTQMDHSKNAGGWLGVRSSARRAMALGEYDWTSESVDKYGRHIVPGLNFGAEDWRTSPYYQKYQKGGIIQRLKRVLTHEEPLFDKEKIVNRVPGDGQYGGTKGMISAIKHYLFNSDTAVEDRLENPIRWNKTLPYRSPGDSLHAATFRKQHEDAKRMYFGYRPKYGTMEPSQFSPTIGIIENPYQVNPLLSGIEFDNLILPLYAQWKIQPKTKMYGPADTKTIQGKPRVENKGNVALVRDIPYLSNATLSSGFDDKGQYISLYDVWDYNTRKIGKSGDNIAKWTGGKPFEIYQRYYLDDYLDIPQENRGNPYIAPVYITADRNK